MSQKVINAVLTTRNEDRDILRFNVADECLIDIDLDSTVCQIEIKKLFSKILEIAIRNDIEFKFSCEEKFPRELYKDVCKEYIQDISRELKTSIITIRKEMGFSSI